MKKKKGKKGKDSGKDAKTHSPVLPDRGTRNEGLDFGGLPDRDLKKNLGCGA